MFCSSIPKYVINNSDFNVNVQGWEPKKEDYRGNEGVEQWKWHQLPGHHLRGRHPLGHRCSPCQARGFQHGVRHERRDQVWDGLRPEQIPYNNIKFKKSSYCPIKWRCHEKERRKKICHLTNCVIHYYDQMPVFLKNLNILRLVGFW